MEILSRPPLNYYAEGQEALAEIFQLDSLYETHGVGVYATRVMRCLFTIGPGGVLGCPDVLDVDLADEIAEIVARHPGVTMEHDHSPVHVRMQIVDGDDGGVEVHLQPAGGWTVESTTLTVNGVVLPVLNQDPWQWNQDREIDELSKLQSDSVLDLHVVVTFTNGETEELERRYMYG